MTGRLEIIIGCMYAGKSTEMIRRYHRWKTLNKKILVINHQNDTRYGRNILCSHNKKQIDSLSLNCLKNVLIREDYKKSDIIMIEEAQFFDDLLEFVKISTNEDGKFVIISGLSGDSFQQPFGEILNCIPYAESITYLKALCKKCGNGTPAYFTKRIIESTKQIEVGSEDKFIAVCRKHYLEKEKSKRSPTQYEFDFHLPFGF